ncbi:MAG: type IV secretion system protein [Alphaproteobacteria bacterium]|nr:type IV secretion system protein [Alphaproteobacteria bacterium]
MTDILGGGQKKPAISDSNSVSYGYVTDKEIKKTLKESYYQWVSRLMILLCIVSLVFFTTASLVLFRMAPQVSVEPFLIIKQDNSDSMVRYEVIAHDMASRNQIMETFIRQYVMMRNNVLLDEREMQSRWFPGGIVNYLSAPDVYIKFNHEAVASLTQTLKENIVRDTEVISVNKVGGEKSPVWKVDFRTYDLKRGSSETDGRLILKTRYWTASVTAFFIPQRLFMAKRLMNPLGFTVVRYSQTEVEIL